MNEIINNGKVVRGWLGIEAQSLNLKFEDQKDSTPISGVLITATIRNGPAEKAGSIPGDIILNINENITSSPERIIDMITKLKPGTKVKIKILRGWEERDLTAAILQRPAVRFLR